jgi:hypothetical protein
VVRWVVVVGRGANKKLKLKVVKVVKIKLIWWWDDRMKVIMHERVQGRSRCERQNLQWEKEHVEVLELKQQNICS